MEAVPRGLHLYVGTANQNYPAVVVARAIRSQV